MRSFHCVPLLSFGIYMFFSYCVCLCVCVCCFSCMFRVCRIHLFVQQSRFLNRQQSEWMLNCFHATALECSLTSPWLCCFVFWQPTLDFPFISLYTFSELRKHFVYLQSCNTHRRTTENNSKPWTEAVKLFSLLAFIFFCFQFWKIAINRIDQQGITLQTHKKKLFLVKRVEFPHSIYRDSIHHTHTQCTFSQSLILLFSILCTKFFICEQFFSYQLLAVGARIFIFDDKCSCRIQITFKMYMDLIRTPWKIKNAHSCT